MIETVRIIIIIIGLIVAIMGVFVFIRGNEKELYSIQSMQLDFQKQNIDNLENELSEIYQKYNDNLIKDAMSFNNTFIKSGESVRLFIYMPKLINSLNTIFVKEVNGNAWTFVESEFMTNFYKNPEEVLATSIIQDILNFQELVDVEKFADILKAKAVLSKCDNRDNNSYGRKNQCYPVNYKMSFFDFQRLFLLRNILFFIIKI